MKLTNREEEILHILWQKKSAFVKEVIAELNEVPKPHYNTISTLIRKMEVKGLVGYESISGSHKYFPVLQKEEYKKNYFSKLIKNYFDNSYKGMVSFFAEEEKLNANDLREILAIIEKNEKK